MMQVERFINSLEKYVDAAVANATHEDQFTRMAVQGAKTTMTNELRLLLSSGQEDTRTAAQKAAAWRR